MQSWRDRQRDAPERRDQNATAKALSSLYQSQSWPSESEARFRGIFQKAAVALWDEDFSPVIAMLDALRAEGVKDLRPYFHQHRECLLRAIDLVHLNDVNEYTLELFEADRKDDLLGSLANVFLPESEATFVDELVTLWEGGRRFQSEVALRTLKGRRLDVIFTVAYEGERCEQTLVSIVDISTRKAAEDDARRLAAIVENTGDAILSVDLAGAIVSWNQGAENLYGFTSAEVIGKSIALIIPPARRDEERITLDRIRHGDRTRHYETVRQRKDGSLVDVSLTVSPVIDAAGTIVGASKISRDITERRRAHEQQRLLLGEMKHRIKNTLATVQAIAGQTLRSASKEEHAAFVARLRAFADAHELLARDNWERAPLRAVVEAALRPFAETQAQHFAIDGPDIFVDANRSLSLTLALHELATNAVKYGALSNGLGRVHLSWHVTKPSEVELRWSERGGPPVSRPTRRGFGSRLIEGALARDSETRFEFAPEGLSCVLKLPVCR